MWFNIIVTFKVSSLVLTQRLGSHYYYYCMSQVHIHFGMAGAFKVRGFMFTHPATILAAALLCPTS